MKYTKKRWIKEIKRCDYDPCSPCPLCEMADDECDDCVFSLYTPDYCLG